MHAFNFETKFRILAIHCIRLTNLTTILIKYNSNGIKAMFCEKYTKKNMKQWKCECNLLECVKVFIAHLTIIFLKYEIITLHSQTLTNIIFQLLKQLNKKSNSKTKRKKNETWKTNTFVELCAIKKFK